jgi:hypothetical protein
MVWTVEEIAAVLEDVDLVVAEPVVRRQRRGGLERGQQALLDHVLVVPGVEIGPLVASQLAA